MFTPQRRITQEEKEIALSMVKILKSRKTIEQTAKELGVSHGTVWGWYNHPLVVPSKTNLHKIKRIYSDIYKEVLDSRGDNGQRV